MGEHKIKRVGQTQEDRIRREYRARKRGLDWSYYGLGSLRMSLARKWKRPIREIRRIIAGGDDEQ